jgi:hypothetical protein
MCEDHDITYSADQQRVAAWLVNRMNNQVGAGDDPIAFVLASYEQIHAELAQARALVQLCQKFVDDNNITCVETVYQMDHVIEHAYEFIEDVCNIVGYYKDLDA